MKIARFSHGGSIDYGIVDEDALVVLEGDPLFTGFDTTGERVPLAKVGALLAPVIPRSKVVAVGKNYRDHAAEMGGEAPEEPLLFLKPNTAVIGLGDPIVIPPQSERVDFEGELAVVIGKIARNVSAADAAQHIFGYTVANDVTARDLQQKDGQWTRAKGFDTFCPLGPVIETELSPGAVLRTRLNGELKQEAPISDMVHDIPSIIAYASSVFTLLPGDVILTGTPSGIGRMEAGDTVEVEVDGVGSLVNPVRAAK
ncbi:fumarylacetoacetate hydrolase family protein [uncultured Leifsonia sp.]|uniref:fumarylacetoacetate hydrolase family protein n=1 Tax=uncultured Leifsonia sp. TaxID=340359 RepID=UPI0028D57A89|nr:fumarylacetoacetate hydrolase family protein [uncultured Leifsonia sp.]